MNTQHLEPLRIKREKSEDVFRRTYLDKIDDCGEFELMIAELKDGKITESIIRYLPAEVAMFAENCLALYRAEREHIRLSAQYSDLSVGTLAGPGATLPARECGPG